MLLLGWETVAKAVGLQRELRFGAIEIEEVLSDGMLAPELVA